MKIVSSKVDPEVYLNGTVEHSSENFKVRLTGYIRLVINDLNLVTIEDKDINDEEWEFRGDKVQINPLMNRLDSEGFVDLMKEVRELQEKNLDGLERGNEERLKAIFGVEEVYFHSDASEVDKKLFIMKRVFKSFEKELYYRRKDICNSHFNFNFEGKDLNKEFVSYDEFKAKYKLLKKEVSPAFKLFFKKNK